MTNVERAFVSDPPSKTTAERLTAANSAVCEHERNPCILRCGVRGLNGAWEVIPKAVRQRWLEYWQEEGSNRYMGFCADHRMLRFECGCEKPGWCPGARQRELGEVRS